MAQIPTLIEKTERINKVPESESSHPQRIELLEQGWKFHSQLENWYQELPRKVSEPLYCERTCSPFCPSPVSELGSVFPTSLHFKTFEIARMHLFYWAALLLLYNNILTISSSSPGDVHPTSSLILPLEKDVIRRQTLETATMIAQSMEYLLSEEMHILGPQNVFFPLRTAMMCFQAQTGRRWSGVGECLRNSIGEGIH